MEYRVEKDSMGEVQVPSDALYGASTQRAIENFPISNLRFSRRFIWALGLIKGSAAGTSREAGYVPEEIASAIALASDEVVAGLRSSLPTSCCQQLRKDPTKPQVFALQR